MQAAILTILVGLSFLGLTVLALHHERRGGAARRMRLALGVVVGLLSALVVLGARTDLVPDGIEQALSASLVILGVMVVGLAGWYFRGGF